MLAVINGIPAVVDKIYPDGPIDYQAGFPPTFYTEASVRKTAAPFSSSLAGLRPGDPFQVVIQAFNNGGSDAMHAELRAALGKGLRMVSGSCRIRSSVNVHHLTRCPNNFTKGGLSFKRFGRGAWAQIYFDASVPLSATSGSVYSVTAVGDTDGTSESQDTAVIGVGTPG